MADLDDHIRQFASERQLANAYMSLARGHLKRARDLELAIQREMVRRPLGASDRARLTKLIETGEIEWQGTEDRDDDTPF